MKIILLSEGAKTPKRTDEGAAGFDLYIPKDSIVQPGRNAIPLDIRIELDHGTEGQIRPRSGFSLKGMEGASTSNPDMIKRFDADVIIGTLDESYRGVVGVLIKSYEQEPFILKAGTKIAQMVVEQYVSTPFIETNELSETERGTGGFGHTGTK